ncbi:MAG: hypothetical protein ACREPM_11285 [Gemmatimonadaceae bacterium]
MDLGILGGILLIVIWAIGVWFDGSGWLHLLLTVGVFIIIARVVARGDRRHPSPPPS